MSGICIDYMLHYYSTYIPLLLKKWKSRVKDGLQRERRGVMSQEKPAQKKRQWDNKRQFRGKKESTAVLLLLLRYTR